MNVALLTFSVTGIGILVQVFTRRRYLLASVSSAVFAFLIAIIIFTIPMDRAITLMGASLRLSSVWQIFGRTFVLDEFNRQAVGFLYVSGGLILGSAWISKPTRMFHPLGFAILGLVAASLMIVPFLFAAIFLELAAITALLILSTRAIGTARSGLRMLTLYTLAMLAILFAGSIADLGGLGELGFSFIDERITILLAFGFAVLLSIPPFHSWLPIAAEETHPFALVFASTILQAAGLFFVLRFFGSISLTTNEEQLLEVIRIIGATIAWVAALWAASQESFRKMISYAIISDLGVMLIAIGLGTVVGYRIALAITAARLISNLCLALGLSNISGSGGIEKDAKWRIDPQSGPGLLSRLAIYLGSASLVGVPLGAGFVFKWELLQILATGKTYIWFSVILGMAILWLRIFQFARIPISTQWTDKIDRKNAAFLIAGILLTIGVGLVPQVLNPWIERVVDGLNLIIP